MADQPNVTENHYHADDKQNAQAIGLLFFGLVCVAIHSSNNRKMILQSAELTARGLEGLATVVDALKK